MLYNFEIYNRALSTIARYIAILNVSGEESNLRPSAFKLLAYMTEPIKSTMTFAMKLIGIKMIRNFTE